MDEDSRGERWERKVDVEDPDCADDIACVPLFFLFSFLSDELGRRPNINESQSLKVPSPLSAMTFSFSTDILPSISSPPVYLERFFFLEALLESF